MLLSFWASDEALAGFLDVDGDVVNPSPEEKGLLIAFESTAGHCAVFYTPEPSPMKKGCERQTVRSG